MYTIIDDNDYGNLEVSPEMFGLNFVLSYDMEFLEAGPLLNLLGDLRPASLRYPGGSITETMFSAPNYGEANWTSTFMSSLQGGVSQQDSIGRFTASAASVQSTIQLVLPTRIAFEQSAAQAIATGEYGERRKINPEYFNLLKGYIDEFFATAELSEVVISRFEIGNEFWGSGQMTASEYGYLAARVTAFLDEEYPNIDVIAQVSYNAGLFSPVEDTKVFLAEDGDDYDLYFPFQDLSEVEGLVEYTMPGQGSGVGQTQKIAIEFANNPAALSALDGIVDHVYFRGGFDGIDTERNFALNAIPQTFEDYSGSGPIEAFITEWSVRNIAGDRQSEGTNHVGLQYASSTLEAFFELVENDVSGANFWPVTFGSESIDRRVLIDTSDQDYTFGGEIFKLLSENIVGLSPVFDFEVNAEIDTHGFSNESKLVFFVSERSGEASTVEVAFSDFSFADQIFITVTYLGETGTTGIDVNADPVLTEIGGYTTSRSEVVLDLQAWSLAVVTAQNVTNSADTITGNSGDDRIYGRGGDDSLTGNDGEDQLYGNFGHDTLEGGAGDDTLKGGWGNDHVFGGAGDDQIFGTHGHNILSGGAGDDELFGSKGNNIISGNSGNDTITIQQGSNLIFGGGGNDQISILESEVFWDDGYVALNASSIFQTGSGQFVQINGLQRLSNVISGGQGLDTLLLPDGGVAFFLEDNFSEFHSDVTFGGGFLQSSGMARLSGIEEIEGGAGGDLIDLTSQFFSLRDDNIRVDGGLGNDTLWGSDGQEVLIGGAGDDILYGGNGNDILIGGAGADCFEFAAGNGVDAVSDFSFEDGDYLKVYGFTANDLVGLNWIGEEPVLSFRFENSLEILTFNVGFLEDVVDFDDSALSINGLLIFG